MEMTKKTVGQRLTSMIAAGVIASAMLVPAAAFADAPTPSADAQTGKGMTDVTVQLNLDPDIDEFGGNWDPNNPGVDPSDPDSLGKNVAFTVPSKINFISDAQGHLTGPEADSTYIENKSVFGIHASSFKVEAANGWNLVADADAATTDNSADFQFGVFKEGDSTNTEMLDAADVANQTDHKKSVAKPALWNMYDKTTASAAATADNKVNLTTTGDIAKVKKDISDQTKIATITTYVAPQLA